MRMALFMVTSSLTICYWVLTDTFGLWIWDLRGVWQAHQATSCSARLAHLPSSRQKWLLGFNSRGEQLTCGLLLCASSTL